jgi:hypothetical protein
MTYQLTFACSDPGCHKNVEFFCEVLSDETVQKLRQRNPIFQDVLCDAKHSGTYKASNALNIAVIPHP